MPTPRYLRFALALVSATVTSCGAATGFVGPDGAEVVPCAPPPPCPAERPASGARCAQINLVCEYACGAPGPISCECSATRSLPSGDVVGQVWACPGAVGPLPPPELAA